MTGVEMALEPTNGKHGALDAISVCGYSWLQSRRYAEPTLSGHKPAGTLGSVVVLIFASVVSGCG